jgi:hypothetical protein
MTKHAGAYLGDYRSSGRDKVRTTRSVVKANYVSTRSGSSKLSGSLRYYATRENAQNQKQERDIFTKEHDKVATKEVAEQLKTLTKDESYQLGYRIILSPDTQKDTSTQVLRDWTREMMTKVERHHNVQWFAVAHAGDNAHTGHAHVHIVAVMDHRLSKDELASLRQYGDAHWQDIVSRQKMLQQDHTASQHVRQRQQTLTQQHEISSQNQPKHPELPAPEAKEKSATRTYGPEL